MKKQPLGLPLEYKKQPEYFDLLNISEDTPCKNGVIAKLLKEHGVKTVLDLTCGTGSQVFFLTREGLKVTGADFSPALIKIAREKAQKEKIPLSFIEGDMRTLRAGQFDSVISIFNAVGHLTKAGLEKAMRNVAKNLVDGGIFLFDIFNLEALTDEAIRNLAMHVEKRLSDSDLHLVQCSQLNRKTGRLTSYDHYVTQKINEAPKRFYNQFSLQLYTSGELQEMLAKNGFETLAHYGMDGEKFLPSKTPNILTLARKKSSG